MLPFGNVVATVTISGQELKAFLEQGVSATHFGASGRFPQVSGLCFSYAVGSFVGSRVTGVVEQPPDGTCTDTNVNLSASSRYTLATNDFMGEGGDGYPNVSSRMTTRELMYEVLVDYVRTRSPVNPAIQGRITCSTGMAQTRHPIARSSGDPPGGVDLPLFPKDVRVFPHQDVSSGSPPPMASSAGEPDNGQRLGRFELERYLGSHRARPLPTSRRTLSARRPAQRDQPRPHGAVSDTILDKIMKFQDVPSPEPGRC